MMNMVRGTGRMTLLASLVAAGALCLAGTTAYAASITVGTATGAAGGTAPFDVTLQSQGTAVLGTQNDINYNASTPVAVSAQGNCGITTSMTCTTDADCPDLTPPPLTGKEPCVNKNAPDCTVKVAGKGGFFAFEPSNCTGAACTGIRALIFALNNVTTAIPDGSVLYSCNVNIAAGTADGDYALTVPATSVSIADTSFNLVANPTATAGKVHVGPVGTCTCVGDLDMSGDITANEVVLTINAFAQDDTSINPAADCNGDGSVDAAEVVRVINNFAQDSCNP